MTIEREGAAKVGNGDIRPVPDPTALTTQQLLREIFTAKEILLTHIEALESKIETRLTGMDKALQLLQSTTDRVSSEADVKVNHLRALHDERFLSVDQQFKERDIRDAQWQQSSKEAVQAALTSAKEAVTKSETSFATSIERLDTRFAAFSASINATIQSEIRGLVTRADSNKERLDRIEGQGSGVAQSYGVIIGVAGIALAVVAVIIGLR